MVVCKPGLRVPCFELNKNQFVFNVVYLWWCFWNHENSLFNGNYNTLLLYIVVQDPPRWLHTELIELLSLYSLRTPQNLVFSIFTYFVKCWIRRVNVNSLFLKSNFSTTTILEAKPFCTRSIHPKRWPKSETDHDLSKNCPRGDFWRLSCPLFDRVLPILYRCRDKVF